MTERAGGDDHDRAVSSTLSYALGLSIATMLITGLVIGAGGYVEQRRESVTRDGMTVIGQQIASDVQAVDRVVSGSDDEANVTATQGLPERIVGNDYTVVVVARSDAYLRVTTDSADGEIAVTVPLANETDVAAARLDGGDVGITYDEGEDALVIESA
ncbi:hypothetical protein BRC83_05235 [Halobacteriales archaeon QS_1_68_17]|nr:MAG: hypothetical protein BRC83_05235 [Halobacteriales archaeon QS_1_68_17]